MHAGLCMPQLYIERKCYSTAEASFQMRFQLLLRMDAREDVSQVEFCQDALRTHRVASIRRDQIDYLHDIDLLCLVLVT